jgi:hypothetical protein
MLLVVKIILDLCTNYHQEIIPNTSSPWTIGILSCGVYILIIFTLAIGFNYLISRQELYLFVFPYLPCLLWIYLLFLKLFGVLSNRGSGDDSIFEHFVFKCKILNNALILGELSYICYNILLLLFSIGIGGCWKTNPFWYLVCHHKKSGEFGLLVGTLLSL